MTIAPSQLTDEQRAAVVADIETTAGTANGSVRKIAARHDMSMCGLRTVAAQAGLADAWSSGAARTAAATVGNVVTNAQLRANLERDLLEDAEELRQKLFADVTHLHVVKDGPYEGEHVAQTTLPAGPAEWRATMSAIGTAISQANAIARLTNESAAGGQATGLLGQFVDALVADRAHRDAENA